MGPKFNCGIVLGLGVSDGDSDGMGIDLPVGVS